ncbi:hypothetical protein Plhal304r1_c028g0092481 [Plasmopara halstedii]
MDTGAPPLSAEMPPRSPTSDKQSLQSKTTIEKAPQLQHSVETIFTFLMKHESTSQNQEQSNQAEFADDENCEVNSERLIELRRGRVDVGSEESIYGTDEPTESKMKNIVRGGQQGKSGDLANNLKATDSFVSAAENWTGAKSDNDVTVAQDQGMKMKKRKAFCGRLRIAQAVGVGAVIVTVGSGIAICQAYPASPAAIWIQDDVKQLRLLSTKFLYEMRLLLRSLNEDIQMVWHSLLKNKQLRLAAQALTFMVKKKLKLQLTAVSKLINDLLFPFPPAVSYLMDTLNLSLMWVHSLVPIISESIELSLSGEDGVLNRMQSLALKTLLTLAEMVKQAGERMESSLEHALLWTGLMFNLSDGILLEDKFLALLEANEVKIESIKKELFSHEYQALQDVKRFEKRRVAIADSTNAILANTRKFALESIGNMKMAAFEAVEFRLKQLKDQYTRSFDQTLQYYERTANQIKSEGGAAMLAELTIKNQPYVDAAVQATTRNNCYSEDRLQRKVCGTRDGESCGTDYQCGKAEREESISEDIFGSCELLKQNKKVSSTSLAGSKEAQNVIDHITGNLLNVDIAAKHNSFEEGVQIDKVQTQVLKVESSASKDAPVNDCSKGHVPLTTEVLTSELTSSNMNGIASEKKDTQTETVVESHSAALMVKHLQEDILDFTDIYKSLDESERILQEDLDISIVDNTVGHIDDADTGEGKIDKAEVIKTLYDARAHVLDSFELKKKSVNEEQKKSVTELVFAEQHAQVHRTTSNADDTVNQYEEMNVKIALKVTTGKTEAESERIQDNGVVYVHSHDHTAVDRDTSIIDSHLANEAQRDAVHLLQDAPVAIYSERETSKLDVATVATDLSELKQLGQILLKKEDERARIEKELRTIAVNEQIWLESTQAIALSQQESVFDQGKIAGINVPETLDAIASPLSTSALPWSDFAQISLLSIMFFCLAALAGYFLKIYRKNRLLGRVSRRRMRWQSPPNLKEAEEVVLLSDDDLCDQDDSISPAHIFDKASTAEVKATTTVISLHNEDNEVQTVETHDVVDESGEHTNEKLELKLMDLETVVERTTATYMTDSIATPSSDASSDVSTPSISQRTRQRRRQIRM